MRPLRELRAAPPPRDPPFPEDPWRTPPPQAWIGGRVAKERTRCSPDARRGKGGRRMASKLARLVKLRDGQRPLRGEGSGRNSSAKRRYVATCHRDCAPNAKRPVEVRRGVWLRA